MVPIIDLLIDLLLGDQGPPGVNKLLGVEVIMANLYFLLIYFVVHEK